MSEAAQRIAENLARLQTRIADAAQRSGRAADAVSLIAVTKYVDSQLVRVLVECGCTEIAESRPQQLWEKAQQLGDLPIHWHLVGHLQRNKLRRTVPLICLLHSGDRMSLLQSLEQFAAEKGLTPRVLLEVNISGDVSKHGFAAEELAPQLERLAELRHLDICGLMAMAAREGDLQRSRADFQHLRQLRDRLISHCPANISLGELSMGMSRDFEVAIEEGATMVRIGSALFEGVVHRD